MVNKCKICNKEFQQKRYWQIYCSAECQLQNSVNQTRKARELYKKMQLIAKGEINALSNSTNENKGNMEVLSSGEGQKKS